MQRRQQRNPRERGRRPRVEGSRQIRQRFLIVCEGERTEPNYFRAFRVPGLVVEGVARQALQLVRRAIELRDEAEYDQVWCVFDRDDVPLDQFNEALRLAEQNKLCVAYSNQAFELWYLLHFNYYNTGVPRDDYKRMLGNLLKQPYKKNSTLMFEMLRTRQSQAIKHAHQLIKAYEILNPATANPSTTVHLLVEALIKHQGAN